MRVAIVGGPGVGKSTLVRQLADLYHNGSYGEGEKGVWDPRVLEDIAHGRNPVGVTEYFAALYDANYRDAEAHDAPGKVIFFEGARITLEAHMAEYAAERQAALRRVVSMPSSRLPAFPRIPRFPIAIFAADPSSLLVHDRAGGTRSASVRFGRQQE